MQLDLERYQALRARDPRFDGQFFVAVKTTGIYCRPVCPARTPLAASCLFLETAAAAERAGFRPCLRCRPELAPSAPAQSLEEALYAAIRARAMAGDSVEDLAKHAGYSARQLRRLIVQAFGVSPVEIMQTERLLFAKRLLQETGLRASEIALSAGFQSLRRFNALFLSRYGIAPTTLRRRAESEADVENSATIKLRLLYRPPLAWAELLEYLGRRAVPGVEDCSAEHQSYRRTVSLGASTGWVEVRHAQAGPWLEVEFPATLAREAWAILTRLRALLDLDAKPALIDAHLGADSLLAQSVRRHPGLRVPGAWSTFELAVRAVLGQQVSVTGATTLAGRLAARFGRAVETPFPGLRYFAPTPGDLAAASVQEIAAIGLPRARALTLHALAVAAEGGALHFSPGTRVEEAIASLRGLRGFGEWTAQYVAMRGLRFPDAFPAGDLGVRKALRPPGEPALPPEKAVLARAAAWSPWRAYAALHLWQTLHDSAAPPPSLPTV